MRHKNIVIAPCGNKSFLYREEWLKQKGEKEWDLCLLFYHDQINDPSITTAPDFFYHLKGFKYHMLHSLLTEVQPAWLDQYDYFFFLDDDIGIDTLQINDAFALSRILGSSISQPSLSQDSFCSWPIFKQARNSFCRYVGQVEVMAPLFARDALKACLPSFIANRSSWGMDSVWPKILGYPKDKLVVFDTIVMRHTLPVGGGELYQKIGVDPHDEWKAITRQYDARKHNYQEYGRLQIVGPGSNRLKYYYYKVIEFFAKRKQALNDYDLPSRLRSKKDKLFKKSTGPANK